MKLLNGIRKGKKKGLVFKVDFDKAYDFVSWDYILNVMVCMGFPAKWLNWIKGCRSSSRASILVNGSPTKEFSLERGLQHGDPLSPFLFIIAMEGIHVAMDTAMDHGLFRGMSIGLNEYRLSHLLYADDVIFLGEWDENNIKNLITILNCFYLVSGLCLNLSKSNLHGIGVTSHEVSILANITGCAAARIPFRYLGLPVGSNLRHIQNWNEMIQRVKHRLSKWKVNLLLIGGRYTLIRSVLSSVSIYYMSHFKVPESVIKELEQYRSTFFWGEVLMIRRFRGLNGIPDGGFGTSDWKTIGNGVWATIVKVVDQMHEKQIIPLGSMALQLGNGHQWAWTWNRSIRSGSRTEHQLREMLSMLLNVNFIDTDDKWKWEFELDGLFSVHGARKIIDSSLLTTSNIVTRWCRNVPIKANIMMWRLM
ncbi:RNA-directed DNA polymerase, eukaryota [Tanacetum coccineum]|uniref:RNA-directed DNA polymerase, eukaryota n=1 Tax=Tanacetum coccineum TaxID=301880 RepID=A0ABQ5A049_9ASTR